MNAAGGASRRRIAVALFIGWLCVSSSAVVIVLASPVPALAIACGREAVTAIAWSLIALGSRRRDDGLGRAPLPMLKIAASGILLGVHFACWVGCLSLTSVAHGAVLVSVQPLFAGLFGLFLGDRATWRLGIGVIVAIVGTWFMTHGEDAGGRATAIGDAVAVAAAACAALYLTVNRGIGRSVSLPVLLALVNIVATVTIATAIVASGTPWWHVDATFRREGLAILWLGLGPGLVGHGLMNWAARSVPVHVVSVVVLLEPVGAAGLAYWLLNESFGALEALGAALLLGGAAFVSISSRGSAKG